MNTPMANAESMQIGTVDFVSPDEIKVLLNLDAPHDAALNSGVPRPFPRINSYVLVSGEGGLLVSQIEWITMERPHPFKRRGMQDFSVMDLPYPLRKMSVLPLGVLREDIDEGDKSTKYKFSRGIEIFPTVGDPVLIPTQNQLKAIVESASNRRVDIGISPLARNAVVSVDPDRLFGKHLAVLGSTGSGKSCSVAGLIRWSVESAQKHKTSGNTPNSRFIILDPKGEYRKSFKDMNNIRLYGAEKNDDKGIRQLKVPIWLWNSDEWATFVRAGDKAEKTTLAAALRAVRENKLEKIPLPRADMRRFLSSLISITQFAYNTGSPWGRFPQPADFMDKMKKWKETLYPQETFRKNENEALNDIRRYLESLINPQDRTIINFSEKQIAVLLAKLNAAYQAFGGSVGDVIPICSDIPLPFSGESLIRSIEANAEIMKRSSHIETMLQRVKTLLGDAKLKPVISPSEEITLENWLDDYICPSDKTNGSITVIDLSLLPAEAAHVITSVIARVILEGLQRYRRLNNGITLPTVLVMEEADTFIKKYNDKEDENAATICTRVFERIAEEGGKHGLGLVLSSRHPSELSQGVISRCGSFLLHRLSNEKDQELIGKLAPDNLRALLRELSSLPSRKAILLGWASKLPVMVRMNYLDEKYRPESDDPKYWNVWTGDDRRVKWATVAEEWQK